MSNKTPLQMALDRVLELAQKHPYKVKGNHDTYSQYNEAWSDLADLIEQELTDLLPAERECIEKAYDDGFRDGDFVPFDDYFNETFKTTN